MSKTLEFKAFCFEAYRADKKLSGRETMYLFKKYGVLDYLGACFDVLHTAGRAYIVEDIDIFIRARQNVQILCCAMNKFQLLQYFEAVFY